MSEKIDIKTTIPASIAKHLAGKMRDVYYDKLEGYNFTIVATPIDENHAKIYFCTKIEGSCKCTGIIDIYKIRDDILHVYFSCPRLRGIHNISKFDKNGLAELYKLYDKNFEEKMFGSMLKKCDTLLSIYRWREECRRL